MYPPMQPVNNCIYPTNGDDFYVSYNFADRAHYGGATTALVLGQMAHFFILNGNHLDEYKGIINCGFGTCMIYFRERIEEINRYSEKPPQYIVGERVLVVYEGKLQPSRIISQVPTYRPNHYHYRLEIDKGRSEWSEDMLISYNK